MNQKRLQMEMKVQSIDGYQLTHTTIKCTVMVKTCSKSQFWKKKVGKIVKKRMKRDLMVNISDRLYKTYMAKREHINIIPRSAKWKKICISRKSSVKVARQKKDVQFALRT